MAHTQDLAGTLKPLGLGFFRRVPAKTQHWACRSWNRASQGLFRAQITRLNRWCQLAMAHTQDLAGTLKPLGFFCVWLGLPHGGSCGSRPGFLLPSSPASPRSSWASLLLKGLSRRALDLEAGLAENGGVGGVLGPTMGVRDFEVAPLFTMQTRFCSKP